MQPEVAAFLLASGAAAATLLGWVAVALKRVWTARGVGIALLGSAAAMVVISLVELLPPGIRNPDTRVGTVLLFAVGFVVVPLLRLALSISAPSLHVMQTTAVLVMLAIGLHNIPEGAVPYTAAMLSLRAGVVTALAIGVHNIPEGMAVSSAVLAAGGSRRRALAYTSVSMAGELAGAILMLLVGGALSPAGSTGLLALVAGIMVSLSVTQLIPAGLRLVAVARDPLSPAPSGVAGLSPARSPAD